jgi:hypothetical protein
MKMIQYAYYGPKKSKGPLEITDNIEIWLMRMIVGEGGRRCKDEKIRALLCAITNRWFLWPGARFYPTFVSMLRAFSQPINPRWMTGGDLARKYARRDAASKQRLARRARICSMTAFDMPKHIWDAVESFANGKLSRPKCLNELDKPRISNWASLPSTPGRYPWGVDIEGDWFFEDENLKDGNVNVQSGESPKSNFFV